MPDIDDILDQIIAQAGGRVKGAFAVPLGRADEGHPSDTPMMPLQAAAHAAELRERFATLCQPNFFYVGQLVCWKPGLKNKLTAYAKPLVVVEVLPSPLLGDTTDGASSAYFREPLDIVCGEIMSDGQFLCYHYDSRRLQPWPAPDQGGEGAQ